MHYKLEFPSHRESGAPIESLPKADRWFYQQLVGGFTYDNPKVYLRWVFFCIGKNDESHLNPGGIRIRLFSCPAAARARQAWGMEGFKYRNALPGRLVALERGG